MRFRLLRHATLTLDYDGIHVLVDPMLSPVAAMDPVGNAANTTRWPLVPLPIPQPALADLIAQTDLVLVSHTHRDHWDPAAAAALPKTRALLCQPPDLTKIRDQGFTATRAIEDEMHFRALRIVRTGGQHGHGDLVARMGPVSGFLLETPGEPSIWIAGDTVWCPEVEEALAKHKPAVIVLNAGAAQFLTGGPITMDDEDVVKVCRAAPGSRVIAVHFETVNHCLLTRAALRARLEREGLSAQVKIPADGETIALV